MLQSKLLYFSVRFDACLKDYKRSEQSSVRGTKQVGRKESKRNWKGTIESDKQITVRIKPFKHFLGNNVGAVVQVALRSPENAFLARNRRCMFQDVKRV